MDNKSSFLAWIVETIRRFKLKSPKFFQVWQTIGIIALGAGLIPDALQYFEITSTPIIDKTVATILKVAGVVTWINAKLPVDDVQQIIEKTNKLPYTKKQ